jgi:hypothetical protein
LVSATVTKEFCHPEPPSSAVADDGVSKDPEDASITTPPFTFSRFTFDLERIPKTPFTPQFALISVDLSAVADSRPKGLICGDRRPSAADLCLGGFLAP